MKMLTKTMLRSPFILFLVLFAVGVGNVLAASSGPGDSWRVEVTAAKAAVRPAPSTDYNPVGHLIQGGQHEVVDKGGDWLKVKMTGWVHKSKVRFLQGDPGKDWHVGETVFVWRIDSAGKAARVPSAPKSGRYIVVRTGGAHPNVARRNHFHYHDASAKNVELVAPFIWRAGSCESYSLDPKQKSAKGREPLVKKDKDEFSQCVFLRPGRYSFHLKVDGKRIPKGQKLWFDVPQLPQ